MIGRTPADNAILISEQNRKFMEGIRGVFDSNEAVTVELDLVLEDATATTRRCWCPSTIAPVR